MKIYVVLDEDNMPIAAMSTPEAAKKIEDDYQLKRTTPYHGYYSTIELDLDVVPKEA